MTRDPNGPVIIASDTLSATISPLGAELLSLRDADGCELMTDADPAFWTGHAPLLFPVIGKLNGDTLRVDGRDYAMKQHGFARRQSFELTRRDDDAAIFTLHPNDDTRAQYPFEFQLDATYTLDGATLDVAIRVVNPSADAVLPMSFGFHPAFAWPLPYGADRADHRVVFERDEGDTIVELDASLFAYDRPSPLDGRTLRLTDDLFADDALIWSPVRSQSVTYGPEDGPSLRVEFPDTPDLGVWTKPGAKFLCIEPWHGHADPVGFTGNLRDKPGIVAVAPGAEWGCTMRVTLLR